MATTQWLTQSLLQDQLLTHVRSTCMFVFASACMGGIVLGN